MECAAGLRQIWNAAARVAPSSARADDPSPEQHELSIKPPAAVETWMSICVQCRSPTTSADRVTVRAVCGRCAQRHEQQHTEHEDGGSDEFRNPHGHVAESERWMLNECAAATTRSKHP